MSNTFSTDFSYTNVSDIYITTISPHCIWHDRFFFHAAVVS